MVKNMRLLPALTLLVMNINSQMAQGMDPQSQPANVLPQVRLCERAPVKLLEFAYFDEEIITATEKALIELKDRSDENLFNFLCRFTKGYGRAYNPSIAALEDGYLVCARTAVSNKNEEIIPGSPDQNVLKHNRKGQNFFWCTWGRQNYTQMTLYFKCGFDLKNFTLLIPTESPKASYTDIRVMNMNNSSFICCPGDIDFVQQITKIETLDLLGTIEFSEDTFIDMSFQGKNFSVIELGNETYSYLDWFDKKGLYYRTNNRFSGKTQELKYLAHNDPDYPILGSGSSLQDGENAGKNSGIMANYSFTTPNLVYGDICIGVGHIKIDNDPDVLYKQGSNIDTFRTNLEKEYDNNYKENYIRFESNFITQNPPVYNAFVYMMYFYTFKKDSEGNISEFTISDSFLPLPCSNEGSKYKFNLIFPMGITLLPDQLTLLVTAGYGDFHCVAMKIALQDVLDLCVHNIQNLDLNNYKYQIIEPYLS